MHNEWAENDGLTTQTKLKTNMVFKTFFIEAILTENFIHLRVLKLPILKFIFYKNYRAKNHQTAVQLP